LKRGWLELWRFTALLEERAGAPAADRDVFSRRVSLPKP